MSACHQCSASFEITNEDLAFYDAVSPTFAGKKYSIPTPSHCPECRMQRRLAWRNERTLYNRSCDLCHRSIVSVYPTDTVFPVYCNRCWWGDDWDPLSYGVVFDPSRSFLDQYRALHDRVPKLSIQNDDGIGSENCAYCYDFAFGKNSYRCIGAWYSHDSFYNTQSSYVKSVMDSYNINLQCELCYECTDSVRLYHCMFLQNAENCTDCTFGYDLIGCRDCLCCVGLRQKQYYIFNEPHTREEYERKLAQFRSGSWQALTALHAQFTAWLHKFPRKYANLHACEDCTGDHLFHCKNLQYSFSVYNGEHSKFIDRADSPKHCYDLVNSGNPQWCLDCVTPDNSYQTLFSVWCWKSHNILYSDNCHNSEHLLGCLSMKRSTHCILNKQYAKEEYEQLAGEVVENLRASGHWGNLFPISLSPFGYNESAAIGYFPLTREDAIAREFPWKEDLPYTSGKETVKPASIPDDIRHVPDSFAQEILACIGCSRNYKIIPQELAFYRQMEMPIPRKCPDCRHMERRKRRTPEQLWNRTCAHCGAAIQTGYAPDRPEIVYCEKCYLDTVY